MTKAKEATEETTDVATVETKALLLAGQLDAMQVGAVDLNPRSHTFTKEGETKRGVFLGINDVVKIDDETGEQEEYRLAIFGAKDETGIFMWSCGGSNLLSGVQSSGVKEGEPVEIGLVEVQQLQGGRTYKVYSIKKLQMPKKG